MGQNRDQSLVRLNKYLADCGIASRRKADELIASGVVQINGKTVYELGIRVSPSHDKVTVRGKPVKGTGQMVYIIMYKPENVLTSMADPLGRPTVKEFLGRLPVRVFPVGRLDWDTEGLLLLTNDGEFAQRISHPQAGIPKTYIAKLSGRPTDAQLEKLKRGVSIIGGKASALHVERIKRGDSKQYEWVKIIIDEGRNRQVRKMFEKLGFDVKKLKRTAIGQLSLGSLKKGEIGFLSPRGVREALQTNWERPARPRSGSGKPSRRQGMTGR